MNALAIIQLVSAISAALPALIQAVESVFGAVKGQGAVKKDLVQQTVQTALQVAAATGNDEAAKPEVQQAVIAGTSNLIDGIVGAINAAKTWANPVTVGSDR